MTTITRPDRQTLRDTHERQLVEITQRLVKAKALIAGRCDAHVVEELNGILVTLNSAHRSSRNVRRTPKLVTDRELHRRCVDTHLLRITTLAGEIERDLAPWAGTDDGTDAVAIIRAVGRQANRVGYIR